MPRRKTAAERVLNRAQIRNAKVTNAAARAGMLPSAPKARQVPATSKPPTPGPGGRLFLGGVNVVRGVYRGIKRGL